MEFNNSESELDDHGDGPQPSETHKGNSWSGFARLSY